MTYNYRIWGFFMIMYPQKKALLAHLHQATIYNAINVLFFIS